MEKNFKNSELINIARSLNVLMQLKLPVKTGWNLTKNLKKIDLVLKMFDECERTLVEQYAIKDEEGQIKLNEENQFKIAPANIKEFNRERDELLSCENTIEYLTINLSDLDGKDIEPALLFALDFMINEETEN